MRESRPMPEKDSELKYKGKKAGHAEPVGVPESHELPKPHELHKVEKEPMEKEEKE